jgi:hypothetical protein
LAGLAITDCHRFAVPGAGPLLSSCADCVARRRPVPGAVAA